MSEPTNKYGILVAVDGSSESDAAVRWAAREAELHRLPITLVHVVVPVVTSWPVRSLQAEFNEWQEDNGRQVLEHAQKMLRSNLGETKPPDIRTEILYHYAVPTLVKASKDARMLVVGSRGLGAVGRAVLGSTSSGVVHHARCPVAIVHADEAQSPDRTSPVLLGIDGSQASEAATALAFDEASRRHVDLVALHAWSDVGVLPALGMNWHQYEDEGHEVLGERLAGWQERYPDVVVRRRLVCDRAARWLIAESQQAQLVVVGNHGRGGFPGMLLGSVSSAVAQSANAPVIVVPRRVGVQNHAYMSQRAPQSEKPAAVQGL
jgi:nucleotide-binding universal stress UspA family protein